MEQYLHKAIIWSWIWSDLECCTVLCKTKSIRTTAKFNSYYQGGSAHISELLKDLERRDREDILTHLESPALSQLPYPDILEGNVQPAPISTEPGVGCSWIFMSIILPFVHEHEDHLGRFYSILIKDRWSFRSFCRMWDFVASYRTVSMRIWLHGFDLRNSQPQCLAPDPEILISVFISDV